MYVTKNKKTKSKGAKKSFKMNNDVLKSRKYTSESEGALNPNYFVKAAMKTDGAWYLAKIIECRPTEKTLSNPIATRDKSSYEYYIHYEEFDRRMDEWLTIDKIAPTTSYIDPEPSKKGKFQIIETWK